MRLSGVKGAENSGIRTCTGRVKLIRCPV